MKEGGEKREFSYPKLTAKHNRKTSVCNSASNFLSPSIKKFHVLDFGGLACGPPCYMFWIVVLCCSCIDPFCWRNIWPTFCLKSTESSCPVAFFQ